MRGPGFYGLSLASLVAASMAQGGELIDMRPRDERLRQGRQHARRGNDQVRVYLKARSHRDAALAGGGAREVARRQRQLAKIAAK